MSMLQYPQKQGQPMQYAQQRQVASQQKQTGLAYPGHTQQPQVNVVGSDMGRLQNSHHQSLTTHNQPHSVSQTGFRKDPTSQPSAQQQMARQNQQQGQNPAQHAVYSNRIMATNINRERRSPSPVLVPSQFAKKTVAPQPQTLGASSHQQRANSVTPLPVSFSFQGQPNQSQSNQNLQQQRIVTTGNKKILQREVKLNEKLSPVNALLTMESKEVNQPMSALDLGNLFEKKDSQTPSVIPGPKSSTSPPGKSFASEVASPQAHSSKPLSNPSSRTPTPPPAPSHLAQEHYPHSASSFGSIM